jgi:serine/threonine-protein kinase
LRCTHGTSEDARAIHRDLSPRNILITQDGVAKIIDFGLAKEDPRTTTVLTVAGNAFGTPGCIAPEQRTDMAMVDHRADLYALGRSLAS